MAQIVINWKLITELLRVVTLVPLQLLININNILKLNIGLKLFMFADDLVVASSGFTWTRFMTRHEKP